MGLFVLWLEQRDFSFLMTRKIKQSNYMDRTTHSNTTLAQYAIAGDFIMIISQKFFFVNLSKIVIV